MLIEGALPVTVERVLRSKTDVFSELVELSGLDPKRDFISADLRKVNFAGSRISDFNFEFADLRGASWEGVVGEPSNYRYALRGRGSDAIHASDFERWVERVRKGKVWAERFFAFKCIVDNFGENYLTLDLLEETLKTDKSTYMRSTSTLYLAASAYRRQDVQAYCVEMAQASNARVNLFRLMKIRRYARSLTDVRGLFSTGHYTPGGFDPKQLHRHLETVWQKE